MISYLNIKDFAIIAHAEVYFSQGLNILTGETGAGKSIIIQGIDMALGGRSDTTLIRSGADKALIQLKIDIPTEDFQSPLLAILEENHITYESDLIISREILKTGKSLCKINGQLVPLFLLSKICTYLADLHGQYDHQSLLNVEAHGQLLDSYDKKNLNPLKQQVKDSFLSYESLKKQLAKLEDDIANGLRQRAFMAFELQEIQDANLSVEEEEQLESALILLKNKEKIYEGLNTSYELLYGQDETVMTLLGQVHNALENISSYSDALSTLSTGCNELYYTLEDLVSEIRKEKEQIDFSEDTLEEMISRLEVIRKIKSKHGGTVEKTLAYAQEISEKLDLFQHSEEEINSLKEKLKEAETLLLESSLALSEKRKKTSLIIEEKIKEELKQLSFNHSDFKVSFKPINLEALHFTENGIDQIEFLISTNLGEPLKPLSKTSSGGEISRIMLAFKRIIGQYDYIPTMIFDEIDTGISGPTAAVVGKKLKEISKNHQIICITHLPQIAAMGDSNFGIYKETTDNKTQTNIKALSESEKITEIARLVGGENITEVTLKHAEELMHQSKI